MKSLCYIALILLTLGCSKSEEILKTVTPRQVNADESFDKPLKGDKSLLTIHKYDYESGKLDSSKATFGVEEWFEVKFRDTTVALTFPGTSKPAHRFISAKFMNNQETCLLAEFVDSTGYKNYYLIAAEGEKLEAISLERPTPAAYKKNYNKLDRVGSSAFLINNDVLLNKSDLKIFFIKRPKEEERIQGHFILPSPDRKTLVFQFPSEFYQVHYPTSTVFVQPVDPGRIEDRSNYYSWIQSDFSWKKDKKGYTFLKKDDENEIIEMNL